MRPRIITDKQIAKAKEWRKKGFGYRVIAIQLGFTDEWQVRYHISPKRRAQQIKSSKKYQRNNREKFLAQMRSYQRSHKIQK